MLIRKTEFVKSSPSLRECPNPDKPEYAFIGRSNVGKSSLINMLCANSSLAKTSASPGKTRIINHFLINENWYLVDLPGYGYAKVSKNVAEKWGAMVERYLEGRETLKAVCILVDIRRDPTAQDKQLLDYLDYHDIPVLIVATKADKISSNGRAKQLSAIRRGLDLHEDDEILCVSALKRTGMTELLAVLADITMN